MNEFKTVIYKDRKDTFNGIRNELKDLKKWKIFGIWEDPSGFGRGQIIITYVR